MKSEELRIGDVSKMLHISDQMIRYYEKKGIIHPRRSKDGKYRLYSMADVFMIFDAMRYKEWGISLGEVDDIVSGDYFEKMASRLAETEEHLEAEIEYKVLYKTRIKQLKRRMKLVQYNLGKYVVMEKEPSEMFFSGSSEGDNYSRAMMDEKMAAQIFDENNISFFDVCAEFTSDCQVWWYKIDREYFRGLNIRESGERKSVPSQLCLCTFVDMGEMGDFSAEIMNNTDRYMEENGYVVDGIPRGVIIGRGHDGHGSFRRIMELEVPIRQI